MTIYVRAWPCKPLTFSAVRCGGAAVPQSGAGGLTLRRKSASVRGKSASVRRFRVTVRRISSHSEAVFRLSEAEKRLSVAVSRHTVAVLRHSVMTLTWSVTLGWYLRPSYGFDTMAIQYVERPRGA